MKKNLALAMVSLLLLAWYVTLSSWFGNEDKYQGFIEEARRLESKGLYIDAISQYEQAKSIKSDVLEIEEYIADDYLAMGNQKEYKKQLNKIISTYGPVEKDVKKLYEFYKKYSSENSLINWLVELYKKYPDSSIVKEYYNSIKGVYTEQYINYDEIFAYNGKYAVFENNGKKGLINREGKVVIEAVYDDVLYNGYDDDKITVKDGKSYFFINIDGYKTQEPDEEYEYIGTISQKRIVAKKNNKYGYLDSNLKEKINFIYDDATSFYNDVAAVKKGSKWAIINRKGEELTEFLFDNVAVNSRNLCSINNVIWVEQNDAWFLINTKGERIGTDTYQNVKAFECEELCAVCQNNKWGFADSSANLVIDFEYQQAKSFANGLAPVKNGELWGYIDLENYKVIDYKFADAEQMTEKGVAPVSHEGTWTLIELKAMN